MVEKAFKITLLGPGLTWDGLTFDHVGGSPIRTVFSFEAESDVQGTNRVTEEFDLQQTPQKLLLHPHSLSSAPEKNG